MSNGRPNWQLVVDLNADYATVVQANGSELLAFGPILANLEQMAVVVGNADFRFGHAQQSAHLVCASANMDIGQILRVGFLEYRLGDDDGCQRRCLHWL